MNYFQKLFIAFLALSLAALVSCQSAEPIKDYLPPVAAVKSLNPEDEAEPAAKLTDDGYEYKTVRRYKLRTHRLKRAAPTEEYLPPKVDEPTQEYLPPNSAADSADTKLADDGYRYRTVHKYKLRTHRQKRAAPSDEYLPPKVEEPTQEYLPPNAAESAIDTKLADDGYRYRTVHKYKLRTHRQKRDVTEIEQPSKDYLPPIDVELAPDLRTIFGNDGYRYKTVKRFKVRRNKREAAMEPAKDYLPPQEESAMPMDAMPEVKSAELAQDGYRYRTVHKTKYRHRN